MWNIEIKIKAKFENQVYFNAEFYDENQKLMFKFLDLYGVKKGENIFIYTPKIKDQIIINSKIRTRQKPVFGFSDEIRKLIIKKLIQELKTKNDNIEKNHELEELNF